MNYGMLAILAGFGLLYSILAGRIERTWISGPIIFTAFGLLVGPSVLGWLSMESDPELLKSMAELALALVLFTDAAGTDLGVLRRARKLPVRLLALGLPLTILLGFGMGELLFGSMAVFQVALLATMLAPTDAALGQAVVQNTAVPNPVRQGLNVESGLNDGICVPIIYLFMALALGQAGDQSPWAMGAQYFAKVVGVGLLAGLLITGASACLISLGRRWGWVSPSWMGMTVVAIALASFGTAQALGGSGFIACFSGGLLFGGLMKTTKEQLLADAEGIGGALGMLTWILFGAVVVTQALGHQSWQVVLYAVLSLTVIRMLPVFITVSGLGIDTEGKLFIGWFGPRGLASIVFAVIIIGADVPGSEKIAAVVAVTIVLSIIAHGLTANPWASAYGRRHRASES